MPRFDYSPLTEPLDPAVVRHVRDESRAAGVPPTEFSNGVLLGSAIGGIVIAASMMAVVWRAGLSFSGWSGVVLTAYFAAFSLLVLFLLVVGLPYSIHLLRVQWAQFARARAFAAANGMTYTAAEPGRDLDGAIFHLQGSRDPVAGSVFRSESGPGLEVAGHYHYRRDRSEVHWGYLAVDLGRPLPHLVLRGRRRAIRHRHFLSGYDSTPTIDVESGTGAFTLHGDPTDAEAARSIFTPQLLERVGALGRGIDAETVGTRFYVYSSRPFALPRARVIRRLFGVAEAVLPGR